MRWTERLSPVFAVPFADLETRKTRDPAAPTSTLVGIEQILTEGPRDIPVWLRCAYARLLACSSGPVVEKSSTGSPLALRLENAGWPAVPMFTEDPNNPAKRAVFADRVRAASAEAWPARDAARRAAAVGSLAPKVVWVVDREPGLALGLPLYSSRSGRWALQALRVAGYDELTVLLANGSKPEDGGGDNTALVELEEALEAYGPTWLVSGKSAEETLRRLKLPAMTVLHPSYAFRYLQSEGADGYANRLVADGLPRGLRAPPVYGPEAGEIPKLPPSLILPAPSQIKSALALKPKSPGPKRTLKLEQARRLFVTGEAGSPTEAAKLVGVKADAAVTAATEQDWLGEREKFLATVRAKVYERAADTIAKREASAKGLAWEAAEKALRKCVDRIDANELKIGARDAESLTRTALSLSDRVSASSNDPELDRLRSLPPSELAKEIQKTVEAQTGEPAVETPTTTKEEAK